MYIVFMQHNQFYLFDGNINKIIKISESEYLSLKNILQGKKSEIDKNVLLSFQKQGFCCESKINKIAHPATDYLSFYVERRTEKITLQVTQNCNLRCSYCPYSGTYSNRRHQNKKMSLKTAKKAIDYLMIHSKDIKSPNIGFYGGEPLLEKQLIKECVQYVNDEYYGRDCSYTITTNGTLLDEETVDFLVDNQFSLIISLDGPKEVHNLNRIFANGQGSFDIIMKNLQQIEKKYPEFYSRILVNSVITPDHDLACMREFYEINDTMEMLQIMTSYQAENYTDQSIEYSLATHIINNQEHFKLLLNILRKIDDNKISKMYIGRKAKIIDNYNRFNSISGLTQQAHPGGPCIIGIQRLFADVDGNFYPCERVSESSDLMRIGNLEDGIDLEKAIYLMNVGEITKDKCKSCWSFIHCSLCAASADDLSGKLSSSLKSNKCQGVKSTVVEDLRDICFLKEHGFEYLEEEERMVSFTS